MIFFLSSVVFCSIFKFWFFFDYLTLCFQSFNFVFIFDYSRILNSFVFPLWYFFWVLIWIFFLNFSDLNSQVSFFKCDVSHVTLQFEIFILNFEILCFLLYIFIFIVTLYVSVFNFDFSSSILQPESLVL